MDDFNPLAAALQSPQDNDTPATEPVEKVRNKPGPKPKPKAEPEVVKVETPAPSPGPAAPVNEQGAEVQSAPDQSQYPEFKPLRAVIGDKPVVAFSGTNVQMDIRPQLLDGKRCLVIPPRARVKVKTDNEFGGDVLNSSEVAFHRGFAITPARFLGPVEVVIINHADTRLQIADGDVVGQFL